MGLREQTGVPASSPVVTIDGVRIAVSREGAGQPLVCLHAIGHGGRDFEGIAATLKNRFEVIRIDWPGQGRSGTDSHPPTPARYAELLRGALTHFGVGAPILIGNSIGGATAIYYASRHPVRGLVLCDPGGLLEVTPSIQKACAVFARFFAAGEREAWWFRAAFYLYYRFLVLPSPKAAAQRGRIIAACHEIAGVLKSAWLGFGKPESDLRSMAQQLDVPVWFAWAKHDRIVALKQNLPVIRAMRNASVSTFAGGHAAFLEQPEEFLRGFEKFWDRHDLTPALFGRATPQVMAKTRAFAPELS
jgi:pimeloyl-ACP methyl ester carboxylesterase